MKGLSQSGHWPSGNPRYYFRRAGEKAVAMPDADPKSDTFRRAWNAAIEGNPIMADPKVRHKTGTIGAGVRAYLASDAYLALSSTTRGNRRGPLEDIEARYGRGRMADLQPRHIRSDLAPMAANPANNRLKIWRALTRFWVDAGFVEDDAAATVRKRQTQKTDGHTPWTWEDVKTFRARWPIGTQQRACLELAVSTGAARTDLVRLGPGMVDDSGHLIYQRGKLRTLGQTSGIAVVPLFCNQMPDWLPHNPHLRPALDALPRHLTWLSTKAGASRSDKALGNWFTTAARAAKIPEGKTLHGIRKLVAVTMAEAGAPAEKRMAILGHETASEATHYSKSADLKRIIWGTDFSNSHNPVGKSAK
jgi:site-specific recombinase XerD